MRAHIPMTIAVLPAMSLFILFSLSSGAASLYTDDGDILARLELERWYINRARFAPEMEADRLGLINTTSGGHPNYDVCEDTLGSNDFGTTVAQWTPWTGSRPPLAPNRLLSAACEKHSRDMAESQRFTHYSPSDKYYPLNSHAMGARKPLKGMIGQLMGRTSARDTPPPRICMRLCLSTVPSATAGTASTF